jgi:limonene-1,2-epoxide hydrolase
MGVDQETAVRAFVAELDGEQHDAAQVDRIVSHLAPDAQYCVFAWEAPLVGQDAIRAELLRGAARFSDLKIEITAIASAGNTVFVERLDSMTIADTPMTLHVAAVFELDSAGKITEWRDYLDSKEVAAKVGSDVSSAGETRG